MPKKFSAATREAAVRRLLDPNAPPVLTISRELQISEPTLHKWKKEAMAERRAAHNNEQELEWLEATKAKESRATEAQLRQELQEARATINKLALRLLAETHVI